MISGSRMGSEFDLISGCRSCGSDELTPVIDLGKLPLADALVGDLNEAGSEQFYPLTVVHCGQCSLVQIQETVPPDVLYRDNYPYYSSVSDYLVEHSRENVEDLVDRYRLDEHSLVVELASNDGYLLQWFAKQGIPVFGIDPAEGPAQAAIERGIPTICEFFGTDLADRLVNEGKSADVIIGNNVLAHVPDQNSFVEAIARLLKPTGVVVMEFPYVRDMVEHCEFDTIYHEHHCYFSVTAVRELFARHGLNLVRVQHLDIHGGSLRVHFRHRGEPEDSVIAYLEEEERLGVTRASYYADFAERVATIKQNLVALLDGLLEQGARVAGYAAAAKGAIMLNYCGIGTERLEYVVDRNIHKQGKYMPGVHIPVDDPKRLLNDPPDYLLILAWNFKDEIMAQQAAFEAGGGRFIVPVPEPVIVSEHGE
jgi:SAM-dependent methyltransferase